LFLNKHHHRQLILYLGRKALAKRGIRYTAEDLLAGTEEEGKENVNMNFNTQLYDSQETQDPRISAPDSVKGKTFELVIYAKFCKRIIYY